MKLFYITLALCSAFPAYSQYCMTGGPTSTIDSNVQLVHINGQGDSIHHVGCPGVLGVQNLTNLSVTLNASNSYQLTVQFGTCGGNYAGKGEVWIDYDQSGTFDVAESIGTWTGTPPVPVNVYSITVPANAFNGATRMRVIQQEGATSLPLNPCASFQWGSVMDFTINITGGLDCSAYIGDDTIDPIIVSSLPYSDTGDNSYCYGNQNNVYPSPDVYYLVTPSAQTQSIHASLCGSTFDTFLSVIDPQGNVLAYNDDTQGCSPYSELTVATAGEDSLYFIVEGWGLQAGVYSLVLTEQFVGIEETFKETYSLVPNPASDYFSISGISNTNVTISDIAGKTVEVVSNYNGGAIATGSYATGCYYVSFVVNGRTTTNKLIIAR